MKKFISILAALLCWTVSVSAAQAATTQPVSYLQHDQRWGSQLYTITGNTSQTISTSGCGPTSMAMVLDYYIEDDEITPDEIAEYALQHGYRTASQGTSWGLFSTLAANYGLEFLQTSSKQEAKQWMLEKENALIICSMTHGLWTNKGHFIVIWQIQDDTVYINDPNSTEERKVRNSFNYLAQQCKQYFCFNFIQQPQESEVAVEEDNDELLNFYFFIEYFLHKEPLKGDPQYFKLPPFDRVPLWLG